MHNLNTDVPQHHANWEGGCVCVWGGGGGGEWVVRGIKIFQNVVCCIMTGTLLNDKFVIYSEIILMSTHMEK